MRGRDTESKFNSALYLCCCAVVIATATLLLYPEADWWSVGSCHDLLVVGSDSFKEIAFGTRAYVVTVDANL